MNNMLQFIVSIKDMATGTINRIRQSLNSFRDHANQATSQIGGYFAGMLSVGALVAFSRSVVNYIGAIKDASEATGFSGESFQALSMAANESGVRMEKLTMFLIRLRDVQANIGSDEKMQKAFASLGISFDEIQKSSPEQLLQRIAAGIKATGNASAAFDIFGARGAKMLAVLKDLEGGWDNLKQRMSSGIISASDMQAIDEFGDKFETTMTKLKVASARTTLALVAGWKSFWAAMGAMSAGSSWNDAWAIAADQEMPNKSTGPSGPVSGTPGVNVGDQKKEDALRKLAAQRAQIERQGKYELADDQTKLEMLSNMIASYEQIKKHHSDSVKRGEAEVELAKLRVAVLRQELDMREKASAETEKRNQIEAETQDIIQKNAYDKKTPKEQLAETETNIKTLQRQRNAGPMTPEMRLDNTKKLDELDRERTRLRAEIDAAQKKEPDDRATKIQAARDNIAGASRRQVGGEDLAGYFQRISDIRRGRAPQDDAAAQTAENTRIIAENTKALADLGVVKP
jgi:hypothetical protein